MVVLPKTRLKIKKETYTVSQMAINLISVAPSGPVLSLVSLQALLVNGVVKVIQSQSGKNHIEQKQLTKSKFFVLLL